MQGTDAVVCLLTSSAAAAAGRRLGAAKAPGNQLLGPVFGRHLTPAAELASLGDASPRSNSSDLERNPGSSETDKCIPHTTEGVEMLRAVCALVVLLSLLRASPA